MIKAALLIAFAALAGAADAQSNALDAAMTAGQVGERYDGYMGTPGTPSEQLRRQVAAVNLRRRNLYIQLATRRSVLPDVVGLAAACELFTQLAPGEAFLLKGRQWQRSLPGQSIPQPEQCR